MREYGGLHWSLLLLLNHDMMFVNSTEDLINHTLNMTDPMPASLVQQPRVICSDDTFDEEFKIANDRISSSNKYPVKLLAKQKNSSKENYSTKKLLPQKLVLGSYDQRNTLKKDDLVQYSYALCNRSMLLHLQKVATSRCIATHRDE
ncbi:unnamed protein product [Heterobilharzia americana]|nr:unnamed protein product [Heterobilharzia americana]